MARELTEETSRIAVALMWMIERFATIFLESMVAHIAAEEKMTEKHSMVTTGSTTVNFAEPKRRRAIVANFRA